MAYCCLSALALSLIRLLLPVQKRKYIHEITMAGRTNVNKEPNEEKKNFI